MAFIFSYLFSNKSRRKPDPKGLEQSIIDLILEMKQRNPSYGYRRIAMQISNSFGVPIDKDIVQRVLSKHYKNNTDAISSTIISLDHYRWKKYCRGLYQLPTAA